MFDKIPVLDIMFVVAVNFSRFKKSSVFVEY